MKPLSIIIPCYNSEATLEEAFDSACAQRISEPFEIVMVDDGSTDGTAALMRMLAARSPNARCLFHDRNKGGGAARNTGIRNAESDIFFCLDSDDMLPPETLPRMLTMLKDTRCDGVGVGTSIKFVGRDVSKESYRNDFQCWDGPMPFESIFDIRKCSLYSTFMFTRRAFETTGGYPEHHGFDTQGFAFRFLCNGLKAYTCREAAYLHRVKFHQSYYQREEAKGNISENWRKIFEEFLYLFDEKAQGLVLDESIDAFSEKIFAASGPLAAGYASLIEPGARKSYYQANKTKDGLKPYDAYWMGCYEMQENEYELASRHFLGSISSGLKAPRAYRKLMEAACAERGIDAYDMLSKIAWPPKAKPPEPRPSRIRRIARKLRKVARI